MKRIFIIAVVMFTTIALTGCASDQELEKLKEQNSQLQQQIDNQQKTIDKINNDDTIKLQKENNLNNCLSGAEQNYTNSYNSRCTQR